MVPPETVMMCREPLATRRTQLPPVANGAYGERMRDFSTTSRRLTRAMRPTAIGLSQSHYPGSSDVDDYLGAPGSDRGPFHGSASSFWPGPRKPPNSPRTRGEGHNEWTHKQSVQAGIRATVKTLLAQRGYPPDYSDEAVEMVLKQTEVFAEKWAADAA